MDRGTKTRNNWRQNILGRVVHVKSASPRHQMSEWMESLETGDEEGDEI